MNEETTKVASGLEVDHQEVEMTKHHKKWKNSSPSKYATKLTKV
jgi:hypothetical protein